jgi:hypothetical protein
MLGKPNLGVIPYGSPPLTPVQTGYPSNLISSGVWYVYGAASIPEGMVGSNNSYVYTLQSGSTTKVKFSYLLDPGVLTNHKFKYTTIGVCTVKLITGSNTVIATWNENDTVATPHIRSLTEEQVALFNYSDMYIEITS